MKDYCQLLNTNISQGKRRVCGDRIFNNRCIGNVLLSAPVKEYLKRPIFDEVMTKKLLAYFMEKSSVMKFSKVSNKVFTAYLSTQVIRSVTKL